MGIFSNNTIPSQETSLKNIEETLLSLDVTTFIKEYDGDNLVGIFFTINDKANGEIVVKLPFDSKTIASTMQKDLVRITRADKFNMKTNAEAIALVQLDKYIENVAIMVRLGQITLLEAFLSFCYDKNTEKTFFDKIEKTDGIKFLKE
jgi:hypothetical protein